MSAVHQIPLSAIAADALARDQARLDPPRSRAEGLDPRHGLRQPIELFELAEPGELRYGLIAGFRRPPPSARSPPSGSGP